MRAVARLRAADVVLYDALVDRAALRHAPQARWAFVGQARGPAVDLAEDHREGEEALALAAAGVPCEIVPGVSSALARPALCGIPVTHRGLASAFLVVSGHAPSGFTAALESLAPGAATVVVLMGLATRADTGLLLSRGWDRRLPPRCCCPAATAEARSSRGRRPRRVRVAGSASGV